MSKNEKRPHLVAFIVSMVTKQKIEAPLLLLFLVFVTYSFVPVYCQSSPTTSLPPECNNIIRNQGNLSACQNKLYQSIQVSVDDYTTKFAQQFHFCIADPVQERDAAFDFSNDMSFLTQCVVDTEGSIIDRLCGGAEIKAYLKSLAGIIRSEMDGTEAAPISNENCNQTHWNQGCESGWSLRLAANVSDVNDLYGNTTLIPLRKGNSPKACCEGFFCPRGLACMIPCPLGAYCPKATLQNGLCSPYNYQVTPGMNYDCGGAHLWADLTTSNGTFCPAGSYCPSSSQKYHCDSGFFCRQGSTEPSKCYQLTSCNAQAANQNLRTYGLIIIVGLATVLLLVYNCSDQVMHIHQKHKVKTREKAARQVREQFNAMEQWKSAVNRARNFSRAFSRRFSRDLEEIQVLTTPGATNSSVACPINRTINENSTLYNRDRVTISMTEQKPFEEDLYPPLQTEGSKEKVPSMPVIPKTKTEILRYAYGQIEREKVLQNQHLGWNNMVLHGGLNQQQINKRMRIDITFQDLSLFLKGSGKKILCNVTGKLLPGRITAVMGPSGAGKTTFLNALAGKAYNSTTTGIVLINDKADSIQCYRKIIGFVPQDDIVHGDLTVEENLWFSARYRLSVALTKAEKVLIVERIIDALGLGAIRNSRVGTVEKRGISGGQRKRVNVGIEMVMEPSLLILDEPTSGLDSTSSQLVLQALKREANVGVNVGVVLHQPSYGLFKMFDDVMLLAKGGRTVYLGPVNNIEEYFASLGIYVPERINPPDHYMDVLEGVAKPLESQDFDPKILPVKWMQHNGYSIPNDLQDMARRMDASSESASVCESTSSPSERNIPFTMELWHEFTLFVELRWYEFQDMFSRTEDLSQRRTPGFLKQFVITIARLSLQRFRDARLQTQDYLILLLTGACLGLITPTKDSSLGSNNYPYVIIALSLLCMIAALRTFSNDKLQFWRESASSINRVAYFLAKDTVDHFNTLIKPVVFLSTFYFFNNPRSSFVENYLVTVALVYCVVGIAYIFAITLENGPAQLWSVFLPIIFTLIATKSGASGFLSKLQYLTYTRWTLEAYVLANARKYSGVWLITRCVALLSARYDLHHWALCLSILFMMGFAARCVALPCLMLCNRNRQH